MSASTASAKVNIPKAPEPTQLNVCEDWFMNQVAQHCEHVVALPGGGKAFLSFQQREYANVPKNPGDPQVEHVTDIVAYIQDRRIRMPRVTIFASDVNGHTLWVTACESVDSRTGRLYGRRQSRVATKLRGRVTFNATDTRPQAYLDLWVNMSCDIEPIITALSEGNYTPIEQDADYQALNLTDDVKLACIDAREKFWAQRVQALAQTRANNQPVAAAAAPAQATGGEQVDPFGWQ